jgi:PD-(D/E)XK nuclease superfamily
MRVMIHVFHALCATLVTLAPTGGGIAVACPPASAREARRVDVAPETRDEIDATRDTLAAWVNRVRLGDFAATPSASTCRWCDYAGVVPE